MTKKDLITVPVGTTLEEAEKILHQHRVEKLLVVDDKYTLKGLITVKDIQKKLKYPDAAKDSQGRLRVGAAIGATGDFLERAQEMLKTKVDVLAIDSAHGHSSRVLDAVEQELKKAGFPPLAGFAGKFYIFRSAVLSGHVSLAIIGVLNSLLSVIYYLRVIVAMYMEEGGAEGKRFGQSPYLYIAVAFAVAGTLYLGIVPSKALEWSRISYFPLD